MASNIYIGLISGTSMDGVDCALVDFSDGSPNQIDFITTEIPEDLRQNLLALCEDHHGQVSLLGEADIEFSRCLTSSVDRLLKKNQLKRTQVKAIGSHGQTIRHQPSGYAPFTLQIGDPNTLAELTGITTVADFRRRDMAAGGQGAPLVPAFHREIFSSAETDRVILNIGGMANITLLKKTGEISGFDTGPGNVLMDTWIQKKQGHPFDHDGAWASTGTVNTELLADLLTENYFSMPAPKSTGRELFNEVWLNKKLGSDANELTSEDIQATLLALTVNSIALAIKEALDSGDIIICGGGAANKHLMKCLAEAMPEFQIMPSSRLGVLEDSLEAVAFAWMAHQTLQHKTIDFTPFTGARHPVIAGGIYLSANR